MSPTTPLLPPAESEHFGAQALLMTCISALLAKAQSPPGILVWPGHMRLCGSESGAHWRARPEQALLKQSCNPDVVLLMVTALGSRLPRGLELSLCVLCA